MNNAPKLHVSLDKTTAMTCDECGHEVFQEGMMLRKVSKFLTGNPQDGLVPIPVFMCTKCGHINQEFLPKELQTKN
jgi:uncharacterized Zn finger protein